MDAASAADGLNFELPEEIRMLKDAVRRFVDRELIPIERTSRQGHKLRPEVRAHLTNKAKELGLAGRRAGLRRSKDCTVIFPAAAASRAVTSACAASSSKSAS